MEGVFHLSFSVSWSPPLFLSLSPFSLPLYFSFSYSQSNWYDMNSGKCNLLLIKTCCWHRLQTDSNLRLSSSHFSSPLLSSCFSLCCCSNFGSLISLLLSQHSTLSSNPLPLILSSALSTSVILCFLFFPPNFSTLSSICSLFTAVPAPWGGKESPQPGNHRPQQPPHGGEDHH